MMTNGNGEKVTINIKRLATILSVVALLTTAIYSVALVNLTVSSNCEKIEQHDLEISGIRKEITETVTGIKEDNAEIRMNLKRLCESVGVKYIEK